MDRNSATHRAEDLIRQRDETLASANRNLMRFAIHLTTLSATVLGILASLHSMSFGTACISILFLSSLGMLSVSIVFGCISVIAFLKMLKRHASVLDTKARDILRTGLDDGSKISTKSDLFEASLWICICTFVLALVLLLLYAILASR